MKKSLIVTLTVIIIFCLFLAVGCEEKSEHNFATAYSYDDSTHWKECADEGCTEKSDVAEHSYQLTGTVNTCSVCGYSYNTANTYEVELLTMGGTVIPGTTVKILDSSSTQIAEAKTNVRGIVRFSDLEHADYTVSIDETTLPKGYYLPEGTVIELTAEDMKATVKLPSALIDEELPKGHKYTVGSIAYDFRTTSIDENGKEKNISLSAYLAEYNAVILNFWYASCSPCLSEFPYMNEAYLSYSDKIAVIAINSGAETESEVADFVSSTGYDFDFVNDSDIFADYNAAFSVKAYPTTVVIDRYGAIAHVETGSVPSRSAWENMFNHYTTADYVPDYVGKYNGGGSSGGGSALAKPNVEMPTSEEISAKITKTNSYTAVDTFSYLPLDDEYSWPWVLTSREGTECIATSNKDRVNSYSVILIDVELKKGQQVVFDYFLSTEQSTDILYVQVNTVLQHTLSGENNAWNNDKLLYVAVRDGKYQISLTYQKDTMNNVGEDTVYVKNIRIEQGASIDGSYDLLYNAVDNYTSNPNVTAPEEYSGYLNHVTYYYNALDGFYHVALSGDVDIKSAEDPILMADLYYSTPWNSNSVWNLAFAQTGLFNKVDKDYKQGYFEAVEDYTWIQNNNDSRYVPVNKELHDILVDVVADLGRTDHTDDPHNGVDQWLEVCRYYVHYGDNPSSHTCLSTDNTVESLKWRVAKDYGTMTGDILNVHVDVYSVHLPRGNYYRFHTTKSGAYLIHSLADICSDYDVNGIDALGFVCDEKGNVLAENDNFIIDVQGYGEDENGVVQEGVSRYALYDNNFYLYVYLEADTTYYVAGCFNDPYAMGEYDVAIEYLGESYTYFTSCATDPAYTFDEDDPTFTLFILPQMGKDRFFVADDGNYYAQEYDGSQGSLIYIRMVGPTYYNSYSNYTLEQMIENDLMDVNESDKLYLRHCLIESRNRDKNDTLYGYTVATQRLVSILNRLANGSDTEDTSTYSQTSWLLTAYYYRNINELTLQQAQDKIK